MKTQFKKVKAHNYIDYGLATLLMISPLVFNMQPNSMETRITFTIGISILLVNFITYHKLGLARILHVKTHLKVDFFLGLFLALSPFLYGFYETIFVPQLILGLLVILNTLFIKLTSKKLKTANLI
jgi:uncharacterized membrane protein